LKPKDNGTELSLVHDAFEGAHLMPLFGALDNGWLDNMNKILKLITAATDGTTKA
jgi:hypothetical protein